MFVQHKQDYFKMVLFVLIYFTDVNFFFFLMKYFKEYSENF